MNPRFRRLERMLKTNARELVNARNTNIRSATPAYGNHAGNGVAVARCHSTVHAAPVKVANVHAHVTSSMRTPIRSPNTDIALRPCVTRATKLICDRPAYRLPLTVGIES